MQNHFELFDLPVSFDLDSKALDAAYLKVQAQTHPDRFANATAAEKRVAMQWTIRANEAYQALKKPLSRAQYLCELHGADIAAESNTAMPMEFLMQQMQWRETLDEAKAEKNVVLLEQLTDDLHAENRHLVHQLSVIFAKKEYGLAVTDVRKLMFLEKLQTEIDHVFSQIDE